MRQRPDDGLTQTLGENGNALSAVSIAGIICEVQREALFICLLYKLRREIPTSMHACYKFSTSDMDVVWIHQMRNIRLLSSMSVINHPHIKPRTLHLQAHP